LLGKVLLIKLKAITNNEFIIIDLIGNLFWSDPLPEIFFIFKRNRNILIIEKKFDFVNCIFFK